MAISSISYFVLIGTYTQRKAYRYVHIYVGYMLGFVPQPNLQITKTKIR